MSAYYDTKKAAFMAMLVSWGIPLSYNGIAVKCISTPAESIHELTRTLLFPKKSSVISLLYTDFNKLGFTSPESALKANLLSDFTVYEVYAAVYDPAEPTIDLRCNVKV